MLLPPQQIISKQQWLPVKHTEILYLSDDYTMIYIMIQCEMHYFIADVVSQQHWNAMPFDGRA